MAHQTITGNHPACIKRTKWGCVELVLLADLLYGPAQILNGSTLDDVELARVARETFMGRSFCIVRDWLIFDVMVSASTEHELNEEGLKPTILYSPMTVYDSQGKHRPGDSILSGYQSDFDRCIFESKDVLFILAGRGASSSHHLTLLAGVSMVDSLKRILGQ